MNSTAWHGMIYSVYSTIVMAMVCWQVITAESIRRLRADTDADGLSDAYELELRAAGDRAAAPSLQR